MTSSVVSERITTASVIRHENGKGGEKRMASEWEELEKLTKEELIIELVKERNVHRRMCREMRSIVDIDYPEDRRLPVYEGEGSDSETTSDEWARRIILVALAQSSDPSYFDVEVVTRYGLDSEQFDKVYAEMSAEGIVPEATWDAGSGGCSL